MSNSGLKILIIEDDISWAVFVESILTEAGYELIKTANTFAIAKALIEDGEPNVIISDIMVENTNIVQQLIEHNQNRNPIVFMTSFLTDEVFNSTRNSKKITFIAKPFHKYSLLSALELLLSSSPIIKKENNNSIKVFGVNQQKIEIPFCQVVFIEAEGNYSFIHTKNKQKYARKKSLKQIMMDLDSRFIQISKSLIVNSDFIKRVDLGQRTLILTDISLKFGRAYRKELDTYLSDKLFK